MLIPDYFVSEEQAQVSAMEVAKQLDAEDGRAGNQVVRTIEETIFLPIVDTIQYPTRNDRPKDPGFYVFNFNDERGFALISGDKRIPHILGYTGQGTIDPKEKNVKPFLPILFSGLVDYIQDERTALEESRGGEVHWSLIKKLYNIDKDSLDKIEKEKTSDPKLRTSREHSICYLRLTPNRYGCFDLGETPTGCTKTAYVSVFRHRYTTTTTVPMIIKTKWGQGSPYNMRFGRCSYSPTHACSNRFYSVKKNLAGCVSIAQAQVIANFYGRNPNKYGYAWTRIANASKVCTLTYSEVNMMANLIYDVYMEYPRSAKKQGCDATYIADDFYLFGKIRILGPRAIDSGFGLVRGQWRNYNNDVLLTSLRQNSPVLVSARVTKYGNGHEWIMDGIRENRIIVTYRSRTVNYSNCSYNIRYYTSRRLSSTLIHQNLGWEGGNNGWYIKGAFSGVYIPDDGNKFTDKAGGYTKGKRHFRMIPYITAN